MCEQRRQWTARYRHDREDAVWLARVAELPEVHTYGSTLAEAETYLREALALWLQVDEAQLTIRRS